MTPWLALSLGLWLGQTPDASPTPPADATVQDPAALKLQEAWERALQNEEATANAQRDVAQLRAQVQGLQAQISNLQEQISGTQQQISSTRNNAAELDRMRQQRLEQIARAGTLLAAADQALAVGELAVGSTLQEVDAALEQILQSASQTGGGQTVTLVEGARGAVLRALEAAGRRDTAEARWDLWDVTERLRQARRADLDEPSATTVTR
jgi:DNA repair exonuclease SbcCD ATPase subunit